MRRNLSLLLAIVIAGCTADSGGGSPTSVVNTPPAFTSPTTTPAPPTSELTRELSTVGCESAPAEVVIVCEAYEVIQEQYVDVISAETLAAAAAEGLADLIPIDNDERLICALPSDEFRQSCLAASRAGLDSAEAAEAIVTGLATNALDPNSAYFDTESLALLEEEQEGEIEGIGALVSAEDQTIPGEDKQCSLISDTCRILIVSTIEGSPAKEAGLRRDDAIVGVNGSSIDGMTVDEVTAAVRGPAGTQVDLTIDRGGASIDVTLTRAEVRIPILDSDQFGGTGYIHLYLFSENADEQFEEALADLLAEGVDRLVVDLRDNPGGLLDTAIEITSSFLPDGDVVITDGPDSRIAYPVSGAAIVPAGIEVVLVVNKGSASASEVFSAVLQERDRVTVVGESTFGKNTVQQRFDLSNGGALKLTVARWLTPEGVDFGGVGVTPDVELALDSEIAPEDLVAAVLAAA